MGNISVSFKSNYSESRHWFILDTGRDPNSPPTIFDGYLEPNEVTGPLALYSSDGIYAQAQYQRSDGAPTNTMSLTDGSEYSMD